MGRPISLSAGAGSRHTPFQPLFAAFPWIEVLARNHHSIKSHPTRLPSSPEELRISPQSARRVAG